MGEIFIFCLLILSGWPAFHQSTVHASPLLYDIDKDGVREIALATYNGEVLFFRWRILHFLFVQILLCLGDLCIFLSLLL